MPLILTTPHDELQPSPDTLTTLVVNHIWRRHVAHAITQYFERAIGTDTSIAGVPETLNNFHRLLLDLYDDVWSIQIMRLCTIHCDPTVVYTQGQESRVEFDTAQGPYFFDPDTLFLAASNTFRAIEAGIYALLCYFDSDAGQTDFNLSVRRVGDSVVYASTIVPTKSSLPASGMVLGIMRASVDDEFEVVIGAAGLAVDCVYGYAAFVQLALLN